MLNRWLRRSVLTVSLVFIPSVNVIAPLWAADSPIGRTAEAHYDPAEGHGFAKRENQIDALRRSVAWFDKYLKGESKSK